MTDTTTIIGRFFFRSSARLESFDRPAKQRRSRAEVLHRRRFGRGRKYFYRTIWISDTHLGTRGCQSDMLLDFLRHTDSEYLYLVGDVIDCWQLRRGWFWNEHHDLIVKAILDKARNGTRVIYVPGNHDEILRQYTDAVFAGVTVEQEALHVTADGRRLLILHGDKFDGVIKYARWLALLGDHAYSAALRLNNSFNLFRRAMGLSYWSLSAYLKFKVKNAVQFISRFEEALVAEARRRNVEGVVCGHIHHAEIRRFGKVTYFNDGDWVESCTALVEDETGKMEVLRWTEEIHKRVQLRKNEAAEKAIAAE